MLIYNSLFDSRLRYAILAWRTASEQKLSKLRSLQNRAVRFITFSSFRTSVAPLYASLKILPLKEIFIMQKNVFMHSIHYNNLPFTLQMYCEQPEHRYSTRYKTSGNYVLPKSITNRGQRSIKYTGPKAWAEVPILLKDIAFRKPFSKKLKEFILDSIHVEMPPKQTSSSNTILDVSLSALFASDDEDEEFFGF